MAISRRTFLVSAAGAGVGFGLGAISHQFPLASPHFGPDWAPGEETFAPSTCLLCPAHCGIRARLVDGRATRLDGNPLHPVSQGGLCAKGGAGLQLLYHPGRLTGPVERVGPPGSDTFRPISWDAALTRVVSALRSAGQGGASAPIEWMVGDVSGVMAELIAGFSRVTGASRLSVDDYRDGSAEILRVCQGIASPPAFDLGSADVVLSFGAGLSEAWWALPLAARARDAASGRAPRWVQIDARLSRSATGADEWVAVRPGSYGALAMGLTYILVKEGLYDQDDLSSGLAGWEDWTDAAGVLHAGYRTLVLRHGRPDDVSARTGVPVNQLTAVAKTFGQARRGVAVWDQTVSWRSGGMADALAIHALNAVTSRIGRPGGLLIQTPMPPLPGPLEGVPAGAPDLARAALTSATWPAAGDQAAPAAVLFVYQANPVASLPDSAATRNALARVPLVVSFSPFFDETARSANLILPDHTYLERWQDAPAPAAVAFPVWGVVQPIVKPMHNTRATGDVLLDLATRLGGEAKAWARWPSVEELVKQRGMSLAAATRGSTFVDLFRQGELREVQDRGWWLSHGQSPDEYWQTMLETGGWFDPVFDYNDGAGRSQHPGGRIWVYPADARERLQKSGGALAEGFLPAVAAPTGPPPSDFPLQLIPFRVMTLASGGTALMPWLLERLDVLHDQAWETWIEINPATAAAHAVESGARVRVESAAGAFEAAVRVFAGAQPGVVHVPYGLHTRVEGWGVPRGANPLAAVGRRVDPVSGLPDWHSTRVRLVRV